jgi:hypothetical protein
MVMINVHSVTNGFKIQDNVTVCTHVQTEDFVTGTGLKLVTLIQDTVLVCGKHLTCYRDDIHICVRSC